MAKIFLRHGDTFFSFFHSLPQINNSVKFGLSGRLHSTTRSGNHWFSQRLYLNTYLMHPQVTIGREEILVKELSYLIFHLLRKVPLQVCEIKMTDMNKILWHAECRSLKLLYVDLSR